MCDRKHSCDDGICQDLDVVAGTFAALRTGCGEGQTGFDFMFNLGVSTMLAGLIEGLFERGNILW